MIINMILGNTQLSEFKGFNLIEVLFVTYASKRSTACNEMFFGWPYHKTRINKDKKYANGITMKTNFNLHEDRV